MFTLPSGILVGTYRDRGGYLLVTYSGGALRPLPDYAQEFFRDINGLAQYIAEHGVGPVLERALDDSQSGAPVATLDEPLPPANPWARQVLGFGRNYPAHGREMGGGSTAYFMISRESLAGHRGIINVPGWVKKPDYEGEVVLLVGRRLFNPSSTEARKAIVAFTAGNDVTARDVQEQGMPWSMAKSIPGFSPVGPLFMILDDEKILDDICIETVLNGEQVQEACLSEMERPVYELLANATRYFSLAPGDLVFTGTPSGVGHARSPPRYLSDGDVIEVIVKGVSPLVNYVARRGSPK